MTHHSTNITSLPRSPVDDRHSRMIKYTVTMCIRLVCIGLCLVVQGWWLILCIAGAVFLPYVAVVLANAANTKTVEVERPGSVVLADADQSEDHGAESGTDSGADHTADQQ